MRRAMFSKGSGKTTSSCLSSAGLAAMPLNGNGLFESEEDLVGFIRLRRELEKASPRDTFEGGDFIEYELFEVGPLVL